MNLTEKDVRQLLIKRLLDLDYPKSSIILEVNLQIGHAPKHIDLAISDPETNKILAIFEVRKSPVDLDNTVQQITSYTKMLSEDVLAFIYSTDGNSEEIFSINIKNNTLSQVYDLQTFESLKNLYESPIKENIQKTNNNKNTARTWSNIIAGMSASLTIAIIITMATGLFFSDKKTFNNNKSTVSNTAFTTEPTSGFTNMTTKPNQTNKKSLTNISPLPKGLKWKLEANKMQAQITVISDKLSSLEDALTVNPVKALAVPILRKDLDNTEKSLNKQLDQTRHEIDRMYVQNRWFIGLMFTIALSVLSMATSSFFNKKDT